MDAQASSSPASPSMKSPDEKKSPRFLTTPPFSFFQRSPRPKQRTISSTSADYDGYFQPKPDTDESALLHSPPTARKGSHSKSFPRSMSLTSSAESATLFNTSPRLISEPLDVEKSPNIKVFSDSDMKETHGALPAPTSIQIAGKHQTCYTFRPH